MIAPHGASYFYTQARMPKVVRQWQSIGTSVPLSRRNGPFWVEVSTANRVQHRTVADATIQLAASVGFG